MLRPGGVIALASLFGFACVAIGAFGAHGIADAHARALIETGVRYHFFHTMACFVAASLVMAGAKIARFAPLFYFPGVILFSGSLYALALGAPRWIGALTPLGGLAFLIGWIVLARAGFTLARIQSTQGSNP